MISIIFFTEYTSRHLTLWTNTGERSVRTRCLIDKDQSVVNDTCAACITDQALMWACRRGDVSLVKNIIDYRQVGM